MWPILFRPQPPCSTSIGGTWPELKSPNRRPDVVGMVEKTRLDLLIAKAKGLSGDEGIRLLIGEQRG
jgi:hypothetical protein